MGLEQLRVEYVSSTPEPVNHIIRAARVSLAEEMPNGGWPEEDHRLVPWLAREQHWSPFHHVTASFIVECPLFISHQLVRHKGLEFNQVSGRYTEMDMGFYVLARDRPICQEGKVGNYVFSKDKSGWVIDETIRALEANQQDAESIYRQLLERGVAKEVARMVLPQNTMTRLMISGNIRNLWFFLKSRSDSQAQYEARHIANQMIEQLDKIDPLLLDCYKNIIAPQHKEK